jgi:hypothetical protein
MSYGSIGIRSSFLFEHDLFGKPDSTFQDHALGRTLRRLGWCDDGSGLACRVDDRAAQERAFNPRERLQQFYGLAGTRSICAARRAAASSRTPFADRSRSNLTPSISALPPQKIMTAI